MRSYLVADKEDTATAELMELSQRIAVLLESPGVKASQYLQASLDDMLGAVYSLMLAKHYDYSERPKGSPPEIQAVINRAKDMAAGKVRTDGKWTAGFYLNNALFRVSAVYHRILKIVAARQTDQVYVRDLLPEAEARYQSATGRPWNYTNVKEIHEEVNTLKHTADGVYGGRQVTFRQVVLALGEMLDLLEATTA